MHVVGAVVVFGVWAVVCLVKVLEGMCVLCCFQGIKLLCLDEVSLLDAILIHVFLVFLILFLCEVMRTLPVLLLVLGKAHGFLLVFGALFDGSRTRVRKPAEGGFATPFLVSSSESVVVPFLIIVRTGSRHFPFCFYFSVFCPIIDSFL